MGLLEKWGLIEREDVDVQVPVAMSEAPTVEAPSMTAALDKFIGERNKE